MTERNFDAIAFLFDLVQSMLTEFDDYRIDGALKAAKEQHAAALTDSAMFDLLCENFDAWDGEEDSVKEEHAELIEKTSAFIDAAQDRFARPHLGSGATSGSVDFDLSRQLGR